MTSPDKSLIVLAAGRGTRLGAAAEGKPKAAVELAGRPLLSWQLDAARAAGFSRLAVMRGYRPDQLPTLASDVRVLDNPVFDRTNMVYTLYLSRELWGQGVVISYGDIVYAPGVLNAVWAAAGESPSGMGVVVDRSWQGYWQRRFGDPLLDAETLKLDGMRLTEIGQKPSSLDQIQGQYIGMTCFRGQGVTKLQTLLERAAAAHQRGERLLSADRAFPDAYMTDVLQRLITDNETLRPAFIDGDWLEIDTPADLALASQCVRRVEIDGRAILEIHR
jgi:choline kinase